MKKYQINLLTVLNNLKILSFIAVVASLALATIQLNTLK